MTRETWDEVQAILRNNAPRKERRNPGPGCALLQGIVACDLHNERSLSVDYRGRRQDGTDGSFYYHCHGAYEAGGAQCVVFPGRPLDVAVARELLKRLTLPSLDVIAAELEKEKKNQFSVAQARKIAVEQARRRVEDLRARYLVVNPALRDLAEDLEMQLNEGIGTLKRIQAEASSTSAEPELLSKDAFDELVALCEDLPTLFYAATTTHRDRKEILRTMVDRVVVTGRTPETISAIIRWADESESTPVEARLARFAHRVIRELGEQGLSNVEIKKRVNEMGLKTSRGKEWTRETVWVVRFGNGRRAGLGGSRGKKQWPKSVKSAESTPARTA